MKKLVVLVAVSLFFASACGNPKEVAKVDVPTEVVEEVKPSEVIEEVKPSEMPKEEKFPKIDGAIYFRDSVWGMKKEDVKLVEKEEILLEYDFSLSSKGEVNGLESFIIYYFNSNGELSQGCYSIETPHINKNNYIDDYTNLKNALIEKYGEPLTDELLWRNDLYKNDSNNYGMAVSAGHLVYRSKWEKDGIQILLALSGDNFKISHLLAYTDVARNELAPKKESGL